MAIIDDLLNAMHQGNEKLVQTLISQIDDINANSSIDEHVGKTALEVATLMGRVDLVKQLLKCGADPNVLSYYDTNALTHAVRLCDPHLILMLLEHDADPDSPGVDGTGTGTVLNYAVKNFPSNPKQYFDIIKFLVDFGASKYVQDSYENGVMHLVANLPETPATIKLMEYLIQSGYPIDCTNKYFKTPLHIAAYNGSAIMLEMLLDSGLQSADACDDNGYTPLYYARIRSNAEVVELLEKFLPALDFPPEYEEVELVGALGEDHVFGPIPYDDAIAE